MKKEYEQHWDEEVTIHQDARPFRYILNKTNFQDAERVEQIMERAVKDAQWIASKYSKKA